jgi:hypothetical protein
MNNSKENRSPIVGQHHSFDMGLAATYGIECAILIHHFQYWISFNRRMGRNFKEGKYWTYQSRAEIQAHFPYMSFEKVDYAIRKLVSNGVLITANFNKSPMDKTLWYAFADEKAFKVDEDSNNVYEGGYPGSSPVNRSSSPDNPGAIPDTIPDTISTKGSKECKPIIASIPKYSIAAPPPPSVQKIEYRPKVFFTEADYKTAEALHGTTKLNAILDILSSKLSQKAYNYSLKTIMPGGFAYQAYEEANLNNPQPQVFIQAETAEDNRQWFKGLMVKLVSKICGETYYSDYNYVNFRNLETNEEGQKIFYKITNFKDYVKNELKARGYVAT